MSAPYGDRSGSSTGKGSDAGWIMPSKGNKGKEEGSGDQNGKGGGAIVVSPRSRGKGTVAVGAGPSNPHCQNQFPALPQSDHRGNIRSLGPNGGTTSGPAAPGNQQQPADGTNKDSDSSM